MNNFSGILHNPINKNKNPINVMHFRSSSAQKVKLLKLPPSTMQLKDIPIVPKLFIVIPPAKIRERN